MKYFLIGAALFLFACDSDEPLKLPPVGIIYGVVVTGWPPIADQQGTQVTLSGDVELTTLTDRNGRYVFEEVPRGSYDVIFAREGYAEHRIRSVSIVGGEAPVAVGSVSLVQKPRGTITDVVLMEVTSTGATLSPRYECPCEYYYRVFISHDPDVSSTNYEVTDWEYTQENFVLDFAKFGLADESPLYVKIYLATDYALQYFSPEAGVMIYSSVSEQGSRTIQILR